MSGDRLREAHWYWSRVTLCRCDDPASHGDTLAPEALAAEEHGGGFHCASCDMHACEDAQPASHAAEGER